MWLNAINIHPEMISITSFNGFYSIFKYLLIFFLEWHEGTQIEPSIPKKISGI